MTDFSDKQTTEASRPSGEAEKNPQTNTDSASNTRPDLPPVDFTFLEPPGGPDEMGRLSGYRIIRVIGRGGMGVVFEAEDIVLTRRVAIKVPLAASTDAIYHARFLREARITATLSHEHICAVYQAGEQKGITFLVMELLRGENLSDCLDREKTLPVGDALRIARQVAAGLSAAHSKGLVHRDIKPANIWLEKKEGRQGPPNVKVLDFGVAREAQPLKEITSAGQIVGSLGYIAPEQVYAGNLDGRTDLFALGCVMYEMLTGCLPLKGSDTVSSLKAVVYQKAEPIAQVAPHLPSSVCRLIDDLLQKEPSARPASAEVVVERIQKIEHDLARQTAALTSGKNIRVPRESRKPPSWGVLFGVLTVVIAMAVGLVVLIDKLRGPKAAEISKAKPGEVGAAGSDAPIKIGVLHSLTGSLASTETPVAEAALLAIEEINQAGGINGRKIEAILEDGRSTEEGFAAGAEKLITKDGVVAIFGCWSSSSRKRVAAVCAQHDHMLIYPVSYEGLEDSPYVVYVGGGPNQQLVPAVGWAVGLLAKRRFFFVGTDNVYSRASNEIMRDQLKTLKAESVGEDYVPMHELGIKKFAEITARIKESGADAVLSTVDGHQANLAFFHALTEAKVRAEDCPVISFSFYESDLRNLDERETIGHYAVANYFESMKNAKNLEFLERFKKRHPTRVVNDPIVTSYSAVYLWKQAVSDANDPEPKIIREAILSQKFDAPEGVISIDAKTRHAMRTARVGRVVGNREFKVVFMSPEPLPPAPYPPTRTREQWEAFLDGLYRGWGNRWENPAR